ncbi:sodium-dependent transporter [Nocardioides massiliensis]|uniref:Transporter n=1 Tax=Nocardioides massiliensis TaxID=1325935 RepID=A0ABT9NVQ6_9ACTN|nr:sodium-dependent transporter [Nocardioides massiliensis]MDP9823910.1 NSS family neurotransmitter:Na+ symporter [Nocardioides massiliensis]
MSAEQPVEASRGAFAHRRVFIFAAIGSAVGLGNIWRFPYVAYDNGGGAFLIPYLVALLAAGLPFLMLDYAIGHKYRGSAPLSFRRMSGRGAETLGWWQVGICAVIAIYYAAIIAYAIRYAFFSLDNAWGDDPNAFFFQDFLESTTGFGFDFVPGVLWPVVLVWLVVVAIMVAGVQKGIGRTALVFIPVLALAFVALVVQALFLPGAAAGLDAFFTPDWSALTDAAVWGAAIGQIFFSLSVGFGIMITYASYVGRKTDMTGSGLVVGTANSSFELLAGIGVFAALGFMAQANGVAIDEVASNGIGLAFIAFPAIISEAPAGALIGVLFFGSLVLAGLTSLVSVIEVVISAVRDKLDLSRTSAALAVGIPVAVISALLFGTTTGLPILDAMDHFINRFGILLVAVISMLVVAWKMRALTDLRGHLNATGSVPLGSWWSALIAVVIPLALVYVLVDELLLVLDKPYGDLPTWLINTFGWGTAGLVVVVAIVLAQLPWSSRVPLDGPPTDTPEEEVSR